MQKKSPRRRNYMAQEVNSTVTRKTQVREVRGLPLLGYCHAKKMNSGKRQVWWKWGSKFICEIHLNRNLEACTRLVWVPGLLGSQRFCACCKPPSRLPLLHPSPDLGINIQFQRFPFPDRGNDFTGSPPAAVLNLSLLWLWNSENLTWPGSGLLNYWMEHIPLRLPTSVCYLSCVAVLRMRSPALHGTQGRVH